MKTYLFYYCTSEGFQQPTPRKLHQEKLKSKKMKKETIPTKQTVAEKVYKQPIKNRLNQKTDRAPAVDVSECFLFFLEFSHFLTFTF